MTNKEKLKLAYDLMLEVQSDLAKNGNPEQLESIFVLKNFDNELNSFHVGFCSDETLHGFISGIIRSYNTHKSIQINKN